MVSAVPSAGIGDPASMLGGPGFCGRAMAFCPVGKVDRGVEVAVK